MKSSWVDLVVNYWSAEASRNLVYIYRLAFINQEICHTTIIRPSSIKICHKKTGKKASCSYSNASHNRFEVILSGVDFDPGNLIPIQCNAQSASPRLLICSLLSDEEEWYNHLELQSVVSEAGANPILNAVDPLAALTDNLNQHIVAEAFKPRAPAPWEINSFAPPSTIPEEDSFAVSETVHETLPTQRSSRLPSQALPGWNIHLDKFRLSTQICLWSVNVAPKTDIIKDAMLCYAMLCYAMLCYAMLCYAMLCYAMAMLWLWVMLCYASRRGWVTLSNSNTISYGISQGRQSVPYHADDVQYINERGVAIHTFEAEMSDELTVRGGDEVCLGFKMGVFTTSHPRIKASYMLRKMAVLSFYKTSYQEFRSCPSPCPLSL